MYAPMVAKATRVTLINIAQPTGKIAPQFTTNPRVVDLMEKIKN